MIAQVTPTPGFIPWYYASPSPWPTPVASANAAIAQSFGAGTFYNTSGTTGMLNSAGCFFICYGAPGSASHHMLAYGNDTDSSAYTSQGAPDDCTDHLMVHQCPGGIENQVFSITQHAVSAPNEGFFVSLDQNANFAVFNNVIAGNAIIAGPGTGTPEASPIPSGALVSYSGAGKGNLLLGSASDFLTCDYGKTLATTFTCDKAFVAAGVTSSTGGVRPNGSSGGYAPEAFPLGVASQHPQVLSGSCSVSSSTTCTFPNSFAFPDTAYNCTISGQGTTALSDSYVKTSTTQITIHDSLITVVTFSYICME